MNNDRIARLSMDKFTQLYAKEFIKGYFFITEERQLLSLSKYPYRSDGYIIGICTSGSAIVEVNLKSYNAFPGALLLATPFHILRIYETTEDFRCRFIVFSKDFMLGHSSDSRFIDSFNFFKRLSVPVAGTDDESAQLIVQVFGFLEQALSREQDDYQTPICSSILTTLLYLIARIYDRQHQNLSTEKNRKEELSILFHDLVFQFYKEHRSVQYYADKLFVTPKHLTETIKEVTGKTSRQWIDDAVCLEAKVLLKNSGISITEIAHLLHFPDQSNFGKFFKRQTGLSPKEFRTIV